MPTKRERGKQRKAKKNHSSTSQSGGGDGGDGGGGIQRSGLMIIDDQGNKQLLTPSKIIEYVQMGDSTMTSVLHSDLLPKLDDYKQILIGVLPSLLSFLNRCGDETFEEVICCYPSPVETPSSWMKSLAMANELEPKCRIQISQNIGPLVRSMCNDTDRLFYKSNKHWRESIVPFVALIAKMMRYERDESAMISSIIFDNIMKNEQLLGSVIQWGFWDQYRPDIINELPSKEITQIVGTGKTSIILLVCDALNLGCPRDKKSLEEYSNRMNIIGCTPVVSKEYDPKCTISYVSGLISQMKSKTGEVLLQYFSLIQGLIRSADCVDKGVLTDLVDLGVSLESDYEIAKQVVSTLSLAIRKINDTRVAFSIRCGLVELCLDAIKNFGRDESFGGKENETQNFHQHIYNILKGIHNISLHHKTAKAIRSKRGSIEGQLLTLEDNTSIPINTKCKELLDMVRAILSISGSYCCRCNKSLSRTEVMECNGCHRMIYCSRACQKEDWLNGHKGLCNRPSGDRPSGDHLSKSGRAWPEEVPSDERAADKLNKLEQNITMIELKLFLDNSGSIINQANSMNVPLYDCVVHFDLRFCPPSVDVECSKLRNISNQIKAGSLRVTDQKGKSIEEECIRSKENIICTYHSYKYYEEIDEENEEKRVTMTRSFPHKWLTDEVHRKNEKITTDLLAALKDDPNFDENFEEIDNERCLQS